MLIYDVPFLKTGSDVSRSFIMYVIDDLCQRRTYHTLLLIGYHTLLNPESPPAHHIRQHHISRQSISHNRNVRRVSDARLGMLLEVLHDLVATSWFLGRMGQNSDPGVLFNFCS